MQKNHSWHGKHHASKVLAAASKPANAPDAQRSGAGSARPYSGLLVLTNITLQMQCNHIPHGIDVVLCTSLPKTVLAFRGDDIVFHHVRYFSCKPRRKAKTESVSYPKVWTVFSPKWFEVHCQAYRSSPIHLGSLAV